MSVCARTQSNPVLWRESLRRGPNSLSIMGVINMVAAAALLLFMSDRVQASSSGLLPTWMWWSLAVVLAGTAYQTWTRVTQERSRATLELLRSTPLVPHDLLAAQVHMGVRWMLRAYPLLALWMMWCIGGGLELAPLKFAVLAPIAILMAMCGSLVGVRLALSPRGSGWSLLGGGMAVWTLTVLPAAVDGTLQYTAMSAGYHTMPVGYLIESEVFTLSMLALSRAWMWNADLRALSGFEMEASGKSLEMRMRVDPLSRFFDLILMNAARLAHLDRNPFFMRERARSLRRVSREPALILTALAPALLPLGLELLFKAEMSVILAWCAVPILFMWWMAGAGSTKDALTRELDGRTLDAVRVTALDPAAALFGMVFGRLYPLAIGWLATLPVWLFYATFQGVSPIAVISFVVVLAAVAICSAIGGLRASCTSLALKGEGRYYSEAVSNPALWAWALASPIFSLFFLSWAPSTSPWIPLDVVTLFPTWFGVPSLLPLPLWFVAIGVHALVMIKALRADLAKTWESMQAAMADEIRQRAL